MPTHTPPPAGFHLPPARPKLVVISVRLPAPLLTQLDALARRRNLPRSELIVSATAQLVKAEAAGLAVPSPEDAGPNPYTGRRPRKRATPRT